MTARALRMVPAVIMALVVLAGCGGAASDQAATTPRAALAPGAAGSAASVTATATTSATSPRETPAAESSATATAPTPTETPAPGPTSTPPPATTPGASTPSAPAAPTAVAALATPTAAPPPAVPFAADARTVVIDPGHGGEEVGAANFGVVEKESNLDMAFRVERLLAERGLRPVLTRRADVRASYAGLGATPTGFSAQRVDLQGRVDLANNERAAVFVSLHSNGSTSGAERGIEVYYDSQRPHAAESLRLAQSVNDAVLNELRAVGYAPQARGVKDDSCLRAFQGRCFPLFLLGPERVTNRDEILRRGGNPEALLPPGQDEFRSRATQMPAALVELFFISNAEDAAILRTELARDAMARGVVRGIARYLGVE